MRKSNITSIILLLGLGAVPGFAQGEAAEDVAPEEAAAGDEALATEGEAPAIVEAESVEAPEVVAEMEEAQGAPPPAKAVPLPEPGKESSLGKPDLMSTGERVSVRGGDFTIRPPVGWEVFTTLESLTLLMQVPHQPGMRYQRTIQVASFSEPRFIDEMTAKEYEGVIVQKFSAISSAIEEYRIRNHMNIELADNRKGILFYTEFKLEGVNMMQAHILVSSASRHYLMTFTDVAEHFESDAASQFLTEAWDAMISAELSTATPKRFETFAIFGVGVVVLVVLGFGTVAYRSWRSGRKYQDYADGRDYDAMTADPQTLATGEPSNLRTMGKPGKHGKKKNDVSGVDDDLEDSTTKEDIAI